MCHRIWVKLYTWCKDLGPVIVAIVTVFVAIWAIRAPAWQTFDDERQELIADRNLACLATRFVSPYLDEALHRKDHTFQQGTQHIFDVVIYALKSIDLKKVYPSRFTDQFVDILFATSKAEDWQRTRAIIGTDSAPERDVQDAKERIDIDIGKINFYLGKKYSSEYDKCSNKSASG